MTERSFLRVLPNTCFLMVLDLATLQNPHLRIVLDSAQLQLFLVGFIYVSFISSGFLFSYVCLYFWLFIYLFIYLLFL